MTNYSAIIDDMIKDGKQVFESEFKTLPENIAIAPGAVNIIGEHTDYNSGYICPIGLPLVTVIVAKKSNSRTVRIKTMAEESDNPKVCEFFYPFEQNPLHKGTPLWANHIKGIIQHFDGPKMGLDAVIVTNIPMGRGLSSSSSLQIAMYTLLEGISNHKSALNVIADACNKTQYLFAGSNRDVSNQVSIIHAKKDYATLIDCRSYDVKMLNLSMDKAEFLIVDFITHKIELPESFSEERKTLMKRMCTMAGKEKFGDVTIRDMDVLNSSGCIDQTMYCKARYVLDENERVLKAAEAMKKKNFEQLGQLMNESHDNLKENYDIHIEKQIDRLILQVRDIGGVYGSKTVGGGSGSCFIVLIDKSKEDQIIKTIKEKTTEELKFYPITPSEGRKHVLIKEE